MNVEKQFRRYAARKKLRMTLERKLILSAVMEIHDHFCVSDLLKRLSDNGHPIGQSTVYRVLPHLVDAGLIRKAPRNGIHEEQSYEPILGHAHHDHLICEFCGQIVEFEDDVIEKRQEKVAKSHGYILRRHALELRGVCPKCQDKIIKEAVQPQ